MDQLLLGLREFALDIVEVLLLQLELLLRARNLEASFRRTTDSRIEPLAWVLLPTRGSTKLGKTALDRDALRIVLVEGIPCAGEASNLQSALFAFLERLRRAMSGLQSRRDSR